MRHKIDDLEAVLILTLAATLGTFLPVDIPVLRAILTLPLALFLPGYALATAIFPNNTLRFPERSVLALGLSLALIVLGGIALDYMSVGLQPKTWFFLLIGTTLTTTIVAFARRSRTAQPINGLALPAMTQFQMTLIVSAAGISGLAFVISSAGVTRQPTPAFTQMWIQPTQEAEATSVLIGLRNVENRTVQYRLEVVMNDTIIDSWSSIVLKDGEEWDTQIDVSQENTGAWPVEAYLYLLEKPDQIYRRVSLWVKSPES